MEQKIKAVFLKCLAIAAISVRLCCVFIASLVAFYLGRRGFSMVENMISDLGRAKYTPVPLLHLIGDGVAMILVYPVAMYLMGRFLRGGDGRGRPTPVSLIGTLFTGIGFAGSLLVVVVPLDLSTSIHNAFALVTIIGFGIGGTFWGMMIYRRQNLWIPLPRALGAYMASIPLVSITFFLMAYLFDWQDPFTKELFEWSVFFSIMVWIAWLSAVVISRDLNHVIRQAPARTREGI